MAKKDRIPVPEDVATLLMFRSDRTCCVCHERGEPIQIHHIDEDPSNNDPDNLAVLCFHCHDETQITGGLAKLDAAQVTYYRDDWHRRVEGRRGAADKIALARETCRPGNRPTPTRRDALPDRAKIKLRPNTSAIGACLWPCSTVMGFRWPAEYEARHFRRN